MAIMFPILITGIFFFGSKSRRNRKKKKRMIGESCRSESSLPKGMVCKNGIIYPIILDESSLEIDKMMDGIFETDEYDVSIQDDEETDLDNSSKDELIEDESVLNHGNEDTIDKCIEFLKAVHVEPADIDEIPINKIAVEQTVVPVMELSLIKLKESFDYPIDADVAAPRMIVSALSALVPFCTWEYDEENYEFTFNGHRLEDQAGKDIIYGLSKLSDSMISSFNDQNSLAENG